ncbi:CPBP family glutamic-type intramembrane protease [Dactylosporangium sp. NPDC050588]|uniref:CPBP family glutamic-type intramembrane protease n=1 Tax=Dactylosporangium sp. NPDC050588 TaxID=3157211 RepID=UPI00340494A1
MRVRLAAEFGLVFFVLIAVYAVAAPPGGPIPVLVLLAVVAVLYLRRQPGFDRRDLWRPGALPARDVWRPMLALWCATAVAMTGLVAWLAPDRLFDLPRERPLLWAAIVVFYPLASVYPQELLYRAFLLHRYAPLFPSPAAAALAGALAFGFAHIIFGNVLAVVLTLAGGWLFARRYQQTRSLFVVSVEHAAYALLTFTVGLGGFFYHGA